ncbi:MAG: hypothetical protein U0T83_00840 [Bacteriovoracaceae bacterium]
MNGFNQLLTEIKQKEMITISREKFLEKLVCEGFLFLKKESGTLAYLFAPGEVISEAILDDRINHRKGELVFYLMINEEIIEQGLIYLNQFKNVTDEFVEVRTREVFINYFNQQFVQAKKLSQLDFVVLLSRFFLNENINEQLVKYLMDLNPVLQKRAFLVASYCSFWNLIGGFLDFKFLQDIFLLGLILDYGRSINSDNVFNLYIDNESEIKNQQVSEKIANLKNREMIDVQTFFKNHIEPLIHFPEVASFFEVYRKGKVKEKNKVYVDDWKTIIYEVDNIFDYHDFYYKEKDFSNFFELFIEKDFIFIKRKLKKEIA